MKRKSIDKREADLSDARQKPRATPAGGEQKLRATPVAAEGADDERLERLLDEELRAVAQAPPTVDLRARVMEAIELRRPARGAGPTWRLAPAGTLALATAAAVLLAVFLSWPQPAEKPGGAEAVAGARVPPSTQPELRRHTPGTELGHATAGGEPGSQGAGAPNAAASTMARDQEAGTMARTRSGAGSGSEPRVASARSARRTVAGSAAAARAANASAEDVADATSAGGPYLPGAPVGELGDSLTPLPSPPPIAFAPIAHAPIATSPPVSDAARPVTDFPATDSPSDVPGRTTGESGGMRR